MSEMSKDESELRAKLTHLSADLLEMEARRLKEELSSMSDERMEKHAAAQLDVLNSRINAKRVAADLAIKGVFINSPMNW